MIVNGFSNTNTISSHIQALEQINFCKHCKYEGVSVMRESYYEVTESTDAQSNRSFFSGYCNFLNKLTLVINSWWGLFGLEWRNFKDVHKEIPCERLSRDINERSASSSVYCRHFTFECLKKVTDKRIEFQMLKYLNRKEIGKWEYELGANQLNNFRSKWTQYTYAQLNTFNIWKGTKFKVDVKMTQNLHTLLQIKHQSSFY